MSKRMKNSKEESWSIPLPSGGFTRQNVFDGWQTPFGNHVFMPLLPHAAHPFPQPSPPVGISPQNMSDLYFAHTHHAFNLSPIGRNDVARYVPSTPTRTSVKSTFNVKNKIQTVNKNRRKESTAVKCQGYVPNDEEVSESKCNTTIEDRIAEIHPSVKVLTTESIEISHCNQDDTSKSVHQIETSSTVSSSHVPATSSETLSVNETNNSLPSTSANPENCGQEKHKTIHPKENKISETITDSQNNFSENVAEDSLDSEREPTGLPSSVEDFKNLLDFPDELLNQSNPSSSSMDLESEESDEDVEKPVCFSPIADFLGKSNGDVYAAKYSSPNSSGCSISPHLSAVEDLNTSDHLSTASTVIIEKRSFCDRFHTLEASECHETLYSLQLADGRTLRLISSVPKSTCTRQVSYNN